MPRVPRQVVHMPAKARSGRSRRPPACQLMVDLLSLAHDRACEADHAAVLLTDLGAGRLPDLARLRERFAPDPATLPEIAVHLIPLSAYEALMDSSIGAAA